MNLLPKDDEKNPKFVPEKHVHKKPKIEHIQPMLEISSDMHEDPTEHDHTDVVLPTEKKSQKVIKTPIFNYSPKLFVGLVVLSVTLLTVISVVLVAILLQLRNAEIGKFANYKSIMVDSTPTDADVFINNIYIGMTPLELDNLDFSITKTLRIRKTGYKDLIMQIDKDTVQSIYNLELKKADGSDVQPTTSSNTDKSKILIDAFNSQVLSAKMSVIFYTPSDLTTDQSKKLEQAAKSIKSTAEYTYSNKDTSYEYFKTLNIKNTEATTLVSKEQLPSYAVIKLTSAKDATEMVTKLLPLIGTKTTLKATQDLGTDTSKYLIYGQEVYELKTEYKYLSKLYLTQ